MLKFWRRLRVPGATQLRNLHIVSPFEMQNCHENFKSCKTKVSYASHFSVRARCCLLRRGAWSSFEVRVGITVEEMLYAMLRLLCEAVMNWEIVKSITSLTERDQKYEWGAEGKEAF
ncbi:hypothetical protein Tco_1376052 [Tanacetum coccineum]